MAAKNLGKNQQAVIDMLKQHSLNRLEVASFLHSGNWHFSEWHRPSKKCFGKAAQLMEVLEIKGLIEPAGDSEKIWKRKFKLSDKHVDG